MIKKVHWNCYGSCNMPCDFCYAWFENKPSLNTAQSKLLISTIRKYTQPNTIFTFGGGDPLLRRDLVELIEYARKTNGFKIELQTNAIKLDLEKIEKIIPYVHKFGFSLDGEDEDTHYNMRKVRNNFTHILEILSMLDAFKKKGFKFDVTIRTLVSNKNKHNVKHLIDYLNNFNCVTTWSIRQFVPLEEGYLSKVVHEISTHEFNEIYSDINDYYNIINAKRILVKKISSMEMLDCYCLIAPNGDLYYHPDEGKQYFAVGNALAENAGIYFKLMEEKCSLREKRDRNNFIFQLLDRTF